MRSFYRIIVPTDLSEFSTSALRWARVFQQQFGSWITLVHSDEELTSAALAEHPLGYYFEFPIVGRQELERNTKELGVAHGLASERTEAIVSTHPPARAILDAAEARDADLIIMSTHGRSGLRRAVLGSVAERVLHLARRPVLTVAPASVNDGVPSYRQVVCPVSFSGASRGAVRYACDLATAFHSRLVLVHVVAETGGNPESMKELFMSWIPPTFNGLRDYREVVANGDRSKAILTFSASVGAGVIVLGAERGIVSDSSVLGTTVSSITRNAQCAVITVGSPSARGHDRRVAEGAIVTG